MSWASDRFGDPPLPGDDDGSVDAASPLADRGHDWTPAETKPSLRSLVGEIFARAAGSPGAWLTSGIAIPGVVLMSWSLTWPAGVGLLVTAAVAAVAMIGGGSSASVGRALDAGQHAAFLLRYVPAMIGLIALALVPILIPARIAATLVCGSDPDCPAGSSTFWIVFLGLLATLYVRLGLAIPAILLDGPTVASSTASWRLTRPRTTAIRVAIVFALFLTILAGLIGSSYLDLYLPLPPRTMLIVVGPGCALGLLLLASAHAVLYRRLAGSQSPTAAAWAEPPPAGAGRDLMRAAIALSLAGALIAGVFYVVRAAGALPVGATPPGEIRFGANIDVLRCAVIDEIDVVADDAVVYGAVSFDRVIRADDELVLTIVIGADDPTVFNETPLFVGSRCGTFTPIRSPLPGTHRYEYQLNGDVAARGAFLVR